MKSLYKLLFICILAVTAISVGLSHCAGNFALYRINEQHTEIRNHVYESREEQLESLYKYQKPQELPNLRVYDRMTPGLKKAIDQMENQQKGW